MNKYPLLIGGSPRSGTTALLQLLNSSPHSFISSEEDLIKVINTFKKNLSTQEKRAETLRTNGMREKSVRETITEKNIHSHNFTRTAVWPLIKYNYKWHHKKLHSEAELILWGDKLPNYYKSLGTICNSNKFKYLHITRNPLDTINSMLRRTENAKEGKDWWKAITKFDDMLDAWCDAYDAITQFDQHPNVFHIYYEDLLFDFKTTTKSLNNFFGVDLQYENILLSDPNFHFDRKYLTDEVTKKILCVKQVKNYLEERKNCKSNIDT